MEVGIRTGLIIGTGLVVVGALVQKSFDAKDIEKAISEQKTITQTRVVTVVKEVKHPDGTTETETTTTDNSTKREIEKTIEESVKAASKTWLVSAGTSLDVDRVQYYSVQVQRQILGPVFLGLYGSTHKELGISAGILF